MCISSGHASLLPEARPWMPAQLSVGELPGQLSYLLVTFPLGIVFYSLLFSGWDLVVTWGWVGRC